MIQFKNDLEKQYWIECIRHAEKLDQQSGTMIEARWHKYNYIEYADAMVKELRDRQTDD